MMRRVILIPISLLAIPAIFWLFERPLPELDSRQFLSSATIGSVTAQAYLLPLVNASYAPIRDTTVSDPVLDANVALLYHVDSGRYLYEKNADTRVPIASLTKLLSVMVAQDIFGAQEIVTVASGSIRVDGIRQTLYEGEQIRVENLIQMMLIESSNDAAYALASYANERGIDFVREMNIRANTLGMDSCYFTDPAGLDDSAYCTARDLIRLVRSMLRQAPALWPILSAKELTIYSADGKIAHVVKSTNELLGQISGIMGGKTGNTDGALGCMILVVKVSGKDDMLISVVLGSRARFGDTKALLDWSDRAYHD